ncbi:hypothetical protein [Chryseobacterium binzhouense]|uniref:hypothetical protein n=1 Tax=Chryseobacterium binzhouense TaxID=2593646 RepID=UPI001180D5EF|nr:hypothetical protein [Chryseobacterium binzhouense]
MHWINVSGTQLTEFPIEILNAPKLETIDAKGLKLKNYKETKTICNEKNIRFHYDEYVLFVFLIEQKKISEELFTKILKRVYRIRQEISGF